MNEGLIPRRYAKALYKVAVEQKCHKRIYAIANTLVGNFLSQPALQGALANPFVSANDKSALLMTASDAAVGDTVWCDFVKLLNDNGRINMARDIAMAYISLYRLENRIYAVKVSSAVPLDAQSDARIRKLVAEHLNGAQMEYATEINPELIGGFTISVGNERIDASISNELKKLRLNLISK